MCKNIERNQTKSFKCNFMYEKKKAENIFVEFRHGNEELNKPMKGVKDSGINKNVLGGFINMHMVNVR